MYATVHLPVTVSCATCCVATEIRSCNRWEERQEMDKALMTSLLTRPKSDQLSRESEWPFKLTTSKEWKSAGCDDGHNKYNKK